ncbi:MAG: hypothetical protein AAB483_04255 [Patescibacteria group bacterium]
MLTSSTSKLCANCHRAFHIYADDRLFLEQMKLPDPTFCSECRLQRRLAFRNERSLYKRACDLCKQEIISMFSPHRDYTVYCPSCFHSDRWDPLEYGREYDWDRPFFEQWLSLHRTIPHLSLLQENVVESPWINYETDAKHCYLNVGGAQNEDSAYNQYALKSRDSFDNYWLMQGDYCYESILCERGYKVWFSTLCHDSRETYFSYDCRNCSNIIGCTGLRNQQYVIFNNQVSKEEFEQYLVKYAFSSHENIQKLKHEVAKFRHGQPQRAMFIERSVYSSGNFLKDSKQCFQCVATEKTEDARYGMFLLEVRDAMDTTSVWEGEKLYEFMGGAQQLSKVFFSTGILRGGRNIEYSDMLFNCSNCFGCVNLKNQKYCILNKQYSRDEYDEEISKIKFHMSKTPYIDTKGIMYKYGEFFPPELSPFEYHETVANEYFPLEEQVVPRSSLHQISDYQIPDDIRNVDDDILEKVLQCEISKKPYRITPMELAFYRRFGLPIPRRAPFERHHQRLAFINNHRHLYNAKCFSCNTEIHSAFLPSEFPHVLCEPCYLKKIV